MNQQAKGNFTANMIANAGSGRYGKARPNVRGQISAPGTDRVQAVSLWTTAYTDKDTGEVLIGMNGQVDPVSRADSALDQFKAHANGNAEGPVISINNIELETGKLVIFQSKHKDGNTAANGNLRSDFYGYWNNGGQLVQIGIWAKKNEQNQTAFLGGSTQYPLPGKQHSGAPDVGTMSPHTLETLSYGAEHDSEINAPKTKRARSGR